MNRSDLGMWRSLAARLVWDQEAQGSNPCFPTVRGALGGVVRWRRTSWESSPGRILFGPAGAAIPPHMAPWKSLAVFASLSRRRSPVQIGSGSLGVGSSSHGGPPKASVSPFDMGTG